MELCERLLREAAQEEKENSDQEKHRRMRAYVRRRRVAVPEGGRYVTSEELREEQERYITDLQVLCGLVISSVD